MEANWRSWICRDKCNDFPSDFSKHRQKNEVDCKSDSEAHCILGPVHITEVR